MSREKKSRNPKIFPGTRNKIVLGTFSESSSGSDGDGDTLDKNSGGSGDVTLSPEITPPAYVATPGTKRKKPKSKPQSQTSQVSLLGAVTVVPQRFVSTKEERRYKRELGKVKKLEKFKSTSQKNQPKGGKIVEPKGCIVHILKKDMKLYQVHKSTILSGTTSGSNTNLEFYLYRPSIRTDCYKIISPLLVLNKHCGNIYGTGNEDCVDGFISKENRGVIKITNIKSLEKISFDSQCFSDSPGKPKIISHIPKKNKKKIWQTNITNPSGNKEINLLGGESVTSFSFFARGGDIHMDIMS